MNETLNLAQLYLNNKDLGLIPVLDQYKCDTTYTIHNITLSYVPLIRRTVDAEFSCTSNVVGYIVSLEASVTSNYPKHLNPTYTGCVSRSAFNDILYIFNRHNVNAVADIANILRKDYKLR